MGTNDDMMGVGHKIFALWELKEYSGGSNGSAGLVTMHRAAWWKKF